MRAVASFTLRHHDLVQISVLALSGNQLLCVELPRGSNVEDIHIKTNMFSTTRASQTHILLFYSLFVQFCRVFGSLLKPEP